MYGITLWEMYTFGEEPWAGLSGREILQRVILFSYPIYYLLLISFGILDRSKE